MRVEISVREEVPEEEELKQRVVEELAVTGGELLGEKEWEPLQL